MPASAIRVLLIEDDEDDYILARSLLGAIPQHAVRIQWVRDYEAGLLQLAASQYDVALVDYRLGAEDGVALIREARSLGCRQAIILLTGQADREIDLAATRAGASDFLSKMDVTSTLLERSIRYSIQNAKLEDQRMRLLAERAARAEAEAGSRAKDQFLATLSHELRTPLTPVLIAVAAMANDPALPPTIRQDVEMIHRNIELEAKLIDDLLDLTRITRGKLELRATEVDIHEQLSHVLKSCEPDARAGSLKLTVSTAATHSQIRGDPARIQQILWNLVKNAMKFTPSGGSVFVTTADEMPHNSSSSLPPSSTASGKDSPAFVAVTVRDTGVGIEPDVLPRIFDAFEQGGRQVTRSFGGLGLGLTVSKALADLHGGSVTAISEGQGKGATFTLRLPIPKLTPVSPGPNPPVSAGAASAPARILFVEDHADTAMALTRVLTHSGYKVRQADSVAAAMRAVDEERFDLLISDIGLPDGSGLDVMEYVQKSHPFPGIAVSGYGMEDDVAATLKAGFMQHLTKPVHPDVLLATVAKAIEAGSKSRQ